MINYASYRATCFFRVTSRASRSLPVDFQLFYTILEIFKIFRLSRGGILLRFELWNERDDREDDHEQGNGIREESANGYTSTNILQ